MITFAHKKRLHDLEHNTSRPFATIEDQIRHAGKIEYKTKILKTHEKNTNLQIVEVFEAIKRGESYTIG